MYIICEEQRGCGTWVWSPVGRSPPSPLTGLVHGSSMFYSSNTFSQCHSWNRTRWRRWVLGEHVALASDQIFRQPHRQISKYILCSISMWINRCGWLAPDEVQEPSLLPSKRPTSLLLTPTPPTSPPTASPPWTRESPKPALVSTRQSLEWWCGCSLGKIVSVYSCTVVTEVQ